MVILEFFWRSLVARPVAKQIEVVFKITGGVTKVSTCSIEQCYFFLLLCHCNVSIMLKIMLGFHRNNNKPTAQTKALCDMITHDVT